MSTRWADRDKAGNSFTVTPKEYSEEDVAPSKPLTVFHLVVAGYTVAWQLTPDKARELASALNGWATKAEPGEPDTVRFGQLVNELNDLAVAIAAKGK